MKLHRLVRKLVRNLKPKNVQNVKSDQKELFESQNSSLLQDLPELVLCLVCEHLSYEDLLVLRCVCKGLKQFVDGKEFTKLNLFIHIFPYNRKLFYTNQPIGHPHSLHSYNASILSSENFKEQFCNVQRMIICGLEKSIVKDWIDPEPIKLNLASLNCFKRLNHLEIIEVAKIEGRLSLEELQIASFLPDARSDLSIELNCPRLRALKVDWCMLSLTSETNELEHLYGSFDKADQLTRLYPNIQKLSTICFISFENLTKFISDLLMDQLRLPSLARIGLEECDDFDEWDVLASSLEDLKRNLRTRHIEFTLNGRPISSPEELRQMLSLVRAHDFGDELVGKYLNFSELMDNSLLFLNANPILHWLFPAVFDIVLHKRTEMSEEMIRKLENIVQLEFRWKCKPTEYQFELFARHCISLRWLRVYHLTITERLLEMLSEHMVNLKSLEIFECRCKTVPFGKPLSKFRNLTLVGFDFDPQRDQLASIFSNSRTSKNVDILAKPSVELMMRINGDTKEFAIRILRNQIVQLDSLDAMIDHLNANWKFKKFSVWFILK